jgi:uncharacterized protein YqfB (UPF0267 family)
MEPRQIETILSSLGISLKFNAKDTMQVFNLFTNTEEYLKLIEKLQSLGIDYSELTEEVYSQEEIESAEFLQIIPNVYCGYPQPEGEISFREVSYDINSKCPKCEQGKIQNAPLRVLKPKMGKNDIAALHWIYEFVITFRLKELISVEGLTGCEFWPLIDHRRNTKLDDVYQLFFTRMMPPMSRQTNIIRADGIEMCDCGKMGYTIKGIPVYERQAINMNALQDFNKSYEWLGGGKTTWQMQIVSKRVYNLFVKHKIRGVRFEPVKVID